jgi:hypothetical protein
MQFAASPSSSPLFFSDFSDQNIPATAVKGAPANLQASAGRTAVKKVSEEHTN